MNYSKWMEKLYMRTAKMELLAEKDGKELELDVYMVGTDGEPDCQIGNFAKNFFIRTPKGIERTKYKAFNTMVFGIKKTLKTHSIEVKEIKLIDKYLVPCNQITIDLTLSE